MKSVKYLLMCASIVWLGACQESIDNEVTPSKVTPRGKQLNERVVTANRASHDLSVINAETNELISTVPMPDDGEPMYVVHIPQAKAVFVGDRANSRVVAFDEDDFSVKGMVPAGEGVFHMWASPNNSRLWVNNDIDNTTSLISPTSMKGKGTAQTPQDLVDLGGKPHDVFAGPDNDYAYVSVLGVMGDNDYVVKYSRETLMEVGRVAVGKDPHISATITNDVLYVPCQGGNAVYVVSRNSLEVTSQIALDGAHGAAMANSGAYFYTADIVNSRIGTIDTETHTLIDTEDCPFPTAHNLAVNNHDSKLFVTHSGGTNDKLSIYTLDPTPTFITSVDVGLNPFGIVYYSY